MTAFSASPTRVSSFICALEHNVLASLLNSCMRKSSLRPTAPPVASSSRAAATWAPRRSISSVISALTAIKASSWARRSGSKPSLFPITRARFAFRAVAMSSARSLTSSEACCVRLSTSFNCAVRSVAKAPPSFIRMVSKSARTTSASLSSTAQISAVSSSVLAGSRTPRIVTMSVALDGAKDRSSSIRSEEHTV